MARIISFPKKKGSAEKHCQEIENIWEENFQHKQINGRKNKLRLA